MISNLYSDFEKTVLGPFKDSVGKDYIQAKFMVLD